jgi:hypothetical protein
MPPQSAEEFIQERAVNLIVAALAPFSYAARVEILQAVMPKIVSINEEQSRELMGALTFGSMFDPTDEALLDTMQVSFARAVYNFVNTAQPEHSE